MDILKTRLKSAFNLLDTDPCPKITIDKNTLVTKDGQPVIELLNSFFKCPSPNTPTLSVCSDPSLQNLAKTIKNVCNPLQKEEAEKVDRFGFTEFGKFSFSEPLVHFSVENEKKNSPPPKAVMLQQNKKENTFRQKYAEKQKEELASSLNEMAGSLKETAVSFGHTLSTDSTTLDKMCSLSLSNEEKAKSLNERLVRHSDGDGVSGAIAPYLFLFILFVLTYWIIKFFPVRGPEFGA